MPVEQNMSSSRGILIVSHHTLDGNYLDYTWANHKSYAKKHGYDYWFRNGVIDSKFKDPQGKNKIFKEGLYWQKIPSVRQAMEIMNNDNLRKYEWVMWIDADAVYTDIDKKIESIINNSAPDDYLIISHDYGNICINAGIWLIKNDDRGRKFLELVEKSFPHFKANRYPEQQAMQDLIYGYLTEKALDENKVSPYEQRACQDSDVINGVKILPQRAMNSYYTDYAVDYPIFSWHAGDYIAHVAGGGDKRPFLKRLLACMKEKGGKNLEGCEVNGSWQPKK